jgi:3-hydroxyisobutyrate dehydrogenase-like beta-hydroxyacid dehydrogenase
MMTTVAWLGTGLLGSAMVERMSTSGVNLVAWNRTASKAEALATFGVRAVSTPAEAVRGADRVHVVLRDDASVNEVLAACGPALDGALVVDHSTVLPSGVLARSAALAGRGIRYLHAPVFMGPAAALAGGGSMYVSGPASVWDAARGALEAMTGRTVYLGERAELAAVYKLVGNAMIITINAGLADALAVAVAAGVTPTDAMGLFDVFNPCGTIAGRGMAMAEGDYRAAFELTMARKDLQLMMDTAAAGQEVLHTIPAIAARMEQLIDAGHGARDFAVLAVDTIPPTVG